MWRHKGGIQGASGSRRRKDLEPMGRGREGPGLEGSGGDRGVVPGGSRGSRQVQCGGAEEPRFHWRRTFPFLSSLNSEKSILLKFLGSEKREKFTSRHLIPRKKEVLG